ncbi:MAG: hypothetical protein HKP02_07485 [Xanthomonadales bacterium]|nr:hypothetical protein [Xanthomonadales bacterium]
MGRNRPFIVVCILLGVILLLSGCAGTARGKKASVYQHDESLSVVDLSRSRADAMVVIRYPAMIDQDAEMAFYRAYETHAIGGDPKVDAQTRRDSQKMAQAMITKSNFYSMSLYRELRDKLPPKSVLLSPHMLVLDDQNRLTSRPLLASEEIPSVVTIDFSVYTFPDPRKMMGSPPLTFGDIVTPLFVVHSNRWLRPSTHGLLLSSEPLLGAAWAQSESQADEQASARLDDTLFQFRRPLDFATFLQEGNRSAPGVPLKSAGQSRRDVVAVEVHPLEKIRMDPELVSRITQPNAPDPFAEDFVKGAATRVASALNKADHDRATFFSRQIALSRFDPSLGEAFLSLSRSEDIRFRLRMGEALIAAEKEFLAAQSESLFEGTYEGLYGRQMRQMIAAEHRLLEERRDLARAQNLSTALAVVALAGAVYAGSDPNSSNFFHTNTFYNAMMLGSFAAVNNALTKNAESKTVGENFLVQMAPAIDRQITVQLEWLESRQEITASDFAGFRERTLGLYQESIRSMAHVFDPQCQFRHPSTGNTGRWFGLCKNGLGISSGYGLIMDGEGHSVEFIGFASEGLATGRGAMILRHPSEAGAVYYEGNFTAGQPDGVVLVEEPGRKPRVRTYRAGRDVGAADADQLETIRF